MVRVYYWFMCSLTIEMAIWKQHELGICRRSCHLLTPAMLIFHQAMLYVVVNWTFGIFKHCFQSIVTNFFLKLTVK